jgi:hypothetical protein
MESFNRYAYLPEVGADDENRLWSRCPADQSYFASDFKTDDNLASSPICTSNNSPDPYQIFAVDLHGFNQERDYKQILEDSVQLREQALSKSNHKKGQTLIYKDFNGREWVIWVAPEHSRQHTIRIHWLTRTELHEDFHTKMPLNGFKEQLPYEYSPAIQLLHQYNPTTSPHHYIPVPFVFENVGTSISISPPSKLRLFTTANLWAKSYAAQHFRDLVTSLSAWAIPITKIVCFGLGTLSAKAGFYGGVLQHMAIFTMARQINKLNPSLPKVQIIVQDPAYTRTDQIIMNRIYSYPCVMFKEDPEAILATDEHTLVVAPFLPKSYPLMQLLALKAGEGAPAGFLCDEMDLDESKTHYTCMDRDSPEVTSMLRSGGYRNVTAALKHQLDEDVFRDVYAENEAYWIERMDMWFREKDEPSVV